MSPETHPMPATSVRTRRDLEEYLGQALLNEYYFREEGRIVRQTSTFLKSYLLEVHPSQDEPVSTFVDTGAADITPTGDPTLWHLVDSREESYFLDLLDGRYPILHTIGLTGNSDVLVSRITAGAHIDHCWFPSKWLRSSLDGQVFGFRLFFQHGLEGIEESTEAENLRRELGRDAPPAFRMHVSDFIGAEEDLAALSDHTQFGAQSALDSLAWRLSDDDGQFIHDEVWHDGKISAWGTSWDRHLEVILRLRGKYSDLVARVESTASIRTENGSLTGAPVTFRLEDRPITDLEKFSASISDPRGPMRLLGSAQRIHDDAWFVEAVDLHTNDRVSIDVHNDMLRVYIRGDSCGNVIPRLLVHIERHVAAQTELSIGGDGVLF